MPFLYLKNETCFYHAVILILSVKFGQKVYNKVAYNLFEMAMPQQCVVKLQIG